MLDARKSYFADANKAYPCYFERRVNVLLVAIGQLISGNVEEDFPQNGQTDGLCVGKELFAAFNEKAELRLFKQLYRLFMVHVIGLKQ